MRACSAHGIIELIESITYRAEWCGIRAIERGEVESPKYTKSGCLKHPCGKGLVGVDLGPQSVVDNMYRASQYDHKSNSYNKKKLSQRWHKFEDGTKVQRDIYSAFLLLCHNDDFKTINQDICISKYETFKKAHDKCISDIKTSGQKVCNSGI